MALGLILISALFHALVGAVMKRASDKLVLRGILGATTAIISLPFALFLPSPPAAVWAVLLTGVSVHFIYHIAQAAAFTRGDMSVVYPVMRGFAPALAALFAYFYLKETLSVQSMAGLVIVAAALIGFGWPYHIKRLAGPRKTAGALGFALLCGLLTAIYTVIDAYGIRLAPHKQAFIAWFFLIEGIGISLIVSFMRRDGLKTKIARDWRGGVIAGILGLITYTSALYAFALAPIAPMAALRETSVVFGAVLAAVWLKEDFGIRRVILSIILAGGLILMQIG